MAFTLDSLDMLTGLERGSRGAPRRCPGAPTSLPSEASGRRALESHCPHSGQQRGPEGQWRASYSHISVPTTLPLG